MACLCHRMRSLFVALSAVVLLVEAQIEPYDCDMEYADWQHLWTPGWKAWCCLNHGRGCETTLTWTTTTAPTTSTTVTTTSTETTTSTSTATTTSSTVTYTVNSTITYTDTTTRTETHTQTTTTETATSSTSTVTTVTSTSTSTIPPEVYCERRCLMDGFDYSCGSRIRWTSKHAMKEEPDPCQAAQERVFLDCPDVCGQCTAAGAGCPKPQDFGAATMIMKRYEEPVQNGITTRSHTIYRSVLAVAGFVVLGSVAMFVTARRASRNRQILYADDLVTAEFLVETDHA